MGKYRKKININMRCIEMSFFDANKSMILWININMRCIEIDLAFNGYPPVS